MTTDQLTINASQSILVNRLNLHHLDINKAHAERENTSRSRRMVLLTVVAEGVLKVQAPPATTFLHPRHFQIPVASRLTESFPQNYNQHFFDIWSYSAVVFCVLRDFGFLDLLSERCTVTGSVATCAADFLCAFGHDERFGGELVLVN